MEHFPCQVQVDQALSGLRNMEIDATILGQAVAGQTALRFYQWDEPTVSIGHFQANQSSPVPERFEDLPLVRRLSGGGAILHDRELTYSCAIPANHPLAREPARLYDTVHEIIIMELGHLGVTCRMRGTETFPDQPFLCFARGDSKDIVIDGHKIVGSAQRRRQGAVLQHGSILLAQSAWTPEFPGIKELANVEIPADELARRLLKPFVHLLEFGQRERSRCE